MIKKTKKSETAKVTKKIENVKKEIPRLSASQAAQWLNCEMSRTVKAGRNIFESNESAQVGTAIHEYADQAIKDLTGAELPKISNPSKIFYARNKNFVDEFVNFYTDLISLNFKFSKAGGKHKIVLDSEKKFEYKSKNAEFVAKVDALIMDDEIAIIFDLKTGFIEVSPECDQMVVTAMILKKLFPALETITAVIIQPALSSVSNADLSGVDPDVLDDLNFENPKYFTPGQHCIYCAGNMVCPKFKENYKYFMSPEFAGKSYDRSAEWGAILENVNVTIKILESVKESALAAAKIGVLPAGYELGFKKIRRAFKSGLTVDNIADELGISKSKIQKTSLETPAQVEKLLKTEKQKEKFAELVSQPSTVYLKKIGEAGL